VTLRDDGGHATGAIIARSPTDMTDGAITLVDAAGPGTLRHSSFTTF